MIRVEGYDLVSPPFAKGAFGNIYYANNAFEPKIRFVVKEIPGPPNENILNEIYILYYLSLNSSYCGECSQFIDAFYSPEKGNCYIVMEYLKDYMDLRNYFKIYTTYNSRYRLEVIKNIFFALKKLHELDVAHVDIKPENLMVNGEGDIKIIDFGVSCIFDRSSLPSYRDKKNHNNLLRNTNDIVQPKSMCGNGGTHEYASKQFFIIPSPNENMFFKNDVWSFGITAFELYVDSTPHRLSLSEMGATNTKKLTPSDIYHKHDQDLIDKLISNYVPNVYMRIILRHCLKVNVNERYTFIELSRFFNNRYFNSLLSAESKVTRIPLSKRLHYPFHTPRVQSRLDNTLRSHSLISSVSTTLSNSKNEPSNEHLDEHNMFFNYLLDPNISQRSFDSVSRPSKRQRRN